MPSLSAEAPLGVHRLLHLKGPGDRIRRLAWDPSGERIAAGFEGGRVWIWSTDSPKACAELPTRVSPVIYLSWSPDGRFLVVAGKAGPIEIWDVQQAALRSVISSRASHLLGLAWTPDQTGLRLAMIVGEAPRAWVWLELWEVQTGRRLAAEKCPDWNKAFVALSSNQSVLAVSLPSGRLVAYCLATARSIASVPFPPGAVFSVEASPDRASLVVGLGDGSIRLWSLLLPGEAKGVQIHDGKPIYSLAFSPDGLLLASKSGDGTVRFTACGTWSSLGSLVEPQILDEETDIAFSGQTALLATLGELNTVLRVWKIDFSELILGGGGGAPVPILFLGADPVGIPPPARTPVEAQKNRDVAGKVSTGEAWSEMSDPDDWLPLPRLRLDEEIREIQAATSASGLRNRFDLHIRTAVRPEDVSQALISVRPRIVQFSCHGEKHGALYLEDRLGRRKRVNAEALGRIFKAMGGIVECVVLNACYSEAQAEVIARHVPYVIGMRRTIGDRSAIAFSLGFYQAVGNGAGIPQAFEMGCAQIFLQGIPEHLTPVLVMGIRSEPEGVNS